MIAMLSIPVAYTTSSTQIQDVDSVTDVFTDTRKKFRRSNRRKILSTPPSSRLLIIVMTILIIMSVLSTEARTPFSKSQFNRRLDLSGNTPSLSAERISSSRRKPAWIQNVNEMERADSLFGCNILDVVPRGGAETTDSDDQDEEQEEDGGDDESEDVEKEDDEENEDENEQVEPDDDEEEDDVEEVAVVAVKKPKARRKISSSLKQLKVQEAAADDDDTPGAQVYDEPFVVSPMMQLYTTFAFMMICRKLDMYQPKIVRLAR